MTAVDPRAAQSAGAAPPQDRRVLMIAFHFPPFFGSSGSRRTVAFTRFLPRAGWNPVVLTANSRAYDQTSPGELQDVVAGMPVVRAFALDAARHLAIRGRYPTWLGVPDRWRSWQPFAYRAGLRLLRRYKPQVIWSTYPIASAHAIAAELCARAAIPWVADMRDPMVEKDPYTGEEYPKDPRIRAARLKIEERVAADASHVVFCTEGARAIFVERFGEAVRARTSVVPNGYDDEAFRDAEQSLPERRPGDAEGFTLVHSGTVYPGDDRGPHALFTALTVLRARGELPAGFRLILRATGYDGELRELIVRTEAEGLVEIAPPLPYRGALREMLTVNGLLLLQGAASNPAVPAKLYEYLRARRPILALVHPAGESARLLRQLSAATIGPLDETNAIVVALRQFFRDYSAGNSPLATPEAVASLSRAAQARDLAALFSRIS